METFDYNLKLIIPEMFLFVWALVVIVFDISSKRRNSDSVGYLTMAGLAITAVLLYNFHGGISFNYMFSSDILALFFKVIFLGSAFMAVGSSFGLAKDKIKNHRGEYYGLILFSTVGMMFLSSSNELISLYVGLELTTIPLFVLAAFYKDKKTSVEAGMKYLIIGAFSSAILLYGLSLLYGFTGTTDLTMIKINLSLLFLSAGKIGPGLILAIVMVIAGISFKLSLVPFHMWAPDVYQGSPTPITAFLSVGSKAAGVVAFARIFVHGLIAFVDPVMEPLNWGIIVAVMAAAAMILGNITALRQHNIKRMLAYSSIAQIGYLMIGMVAVSELGIASVGFYMFMYLFANMGAFAVATIFEDKTGSSSISSYKGLSKSAPALSACMAIFLLSLAGIPPLGGFAAKYIVFAAGIEAGYNWLVITGLLTTVVALYYYTNVIKTIYFSDGNSDLKINIHPAARLVLVIGVIGVIIFGIYPEPILNFAMESAALFALP
ncbi:MAG: NADH-quinone oxidoreductase subunit N [Candidatus Zixiibacteriota bacterium]|nr:MAG: NADH-quinone oxidoreductase subunit N [candidate division Zixibacteria bacterium]